MYKKLAAAVMSLVALLCLAVALTGCGHEHEFGAWVETPATCTEDGVRVRECACGEKEEEILPALEHDYGEWQDDGNATCTADGTETKRCKREGCTASVTQTKQNSALGHDMTKHAQVEPTCTAEGVKEYWECSRCKKNFAEEAGETELEELTLAKLPHNTTKHERVEPTCTTEGVKEYWECSGCHQNFAEQAGETVLEELTLAKLPHDTTKHERVEPTCTTEGVKEYWECSGCHRKFAEQTGETVLEELTLAKLPHNTTKHERVEPTCTTEGVKEYWECSGCRQKFAEQAGETVLDDLSIDKVAHTFEEHIETPATCDAAGKKCRQCKVCGATEREEEIPALGHDMGEWEDDGNATCTTDGTETKRCKRAECEHSETRTKQDSALGHDYGDDGVCRRQDCGDRNGAILGFRKEGDKILFGSYPQSEVKDGALTAALTQKAGALPTANAAGAWNSYGYYRGGSAATGFMYWQDVVYQGEKYRGVVISAYRDERIDNKTAGTTQAANGYVIASSPYWFRYEPISWRVLEGKENEYFLMSELALDAREFYHLSAIRYYEDGNQIAPCSFEQSDIRTWLNGSFYETAFTEYQRGFILKSLVKNTEFPPDSYITEDYPVWHDTQDNVFLLSWKELGNAEYGFGELSEYDDGRMLKPTDYARAQGVEVIGGNVHWWMRSPGDFEDEAGYVLNNGVGMESWGPYLKSTYTTKTTLGVVPALRLRANG